MQNWTSDWFREFVKENHRKIITTTLTFLVNDIYINELIANASHFMPLSNINVINVIIIASIDIIEACFPIGVTMNNTIAVLKSIIRILGGHYKMSIQWKPLKWMLDIKQTD